MTQQPQSSTFAERAKARAKAEKENAGGQNAPRRTTLRAGSHAEGLGTATITHVQN